MIILNPPAGMVALREQYVAARPFAHAVIDGRFDTIFRKPKRWWQK